MAAVDHGEGSYPLEEEIELLEAIYIHELTVEGPRESPTAVSVLLHPSTGDEEHKRFVCLTLVICLPQKYPSVLPSIHIKTPRGLSDAHIDSILSNLRELAESCLGRPMLYELIEYAKESLTDNNVPSCACAICLCHFQEQGPPLIVVACRALHHLDLVLYNSSCALSLEKITTADSHEFTKTECYHYFHCGCLARYIEFSLQQQDTGEDKTKVECPMCRLPITYNLTELQAAASFEVKEDEIVYKPSEEMRKLQKKMVSLFEKQKRKGGVIDIEQERNKFLIDITSVRQEESLPDGDPSMGPAADTVKTNIVAEPPTNNVPKRPDMTKETKEPNNPTRNDKLEKKDKREFPKNLQNSRGPRRPAGNKPGEERFKHNEQRKPEKKQTTGNDRPRSTEQTDREKAVVEGDKPEKKRVMGNDRPGSTKQKDRVKAAKESEEQGTSFLLCADAKQDDPYTESESDNNSLVELSEKVGRDVPGRSNNSSPLQNSNAERPRSGRKGRGRSGRNRTSGERKSEFQDGEKDSKKDRGKAIVKETEEQLNGLASCAGAKKGEDQFEVKSAKNTSVSGLLEKAGWDAEAGRSNNGPSQNSNGERPKSGKRGKGRSGKNRASAESKSELQDGGKDPNKNKTSSGEAISQSAKTRPVEGAKPSPDKPTTRQEGPSDKETWTIVKGKACKPPPGFENTVADKGGRELVTNDSPRPPPGFEKRTSHPRPPPGFGKTVEGSAASTSQSIAS